LDSPFTSLVGISSTVPYSPPWAVPLIKRQDSQQFMLPVTIPMILAIVTAMNVIQEPNGALAFWMSMIPLTSPITMMIRLPFGIPLWEVFLSGAILVVTFFAVVGLAGKIYRVGILMYGKKVTWKELFKWLKY
jgi:ABC-2 type transport system permease protein